MVMSNSQTGAESQRLPDEVLSELAARAADHVTEENPKAADMSEELRKKNRKLFSILLRAATAGMRSIL